MPSRQQSKTMQRNTKSITNGCLWKRMAHQCTHKSTNRIQPGSKGQGDISSTSGYDITTMQSRLAKHSFHTISVRQYRSVLSQTRTRAWHVITLQLRLHNQKETRRPQVPACNSQQLQQAILHKHTHVMY